MLVFPNCKINLGLNITGKRPDGYHNLETIFYPVPFCDALEIIAVPASETPFHFTTSGIPVSGEPKQNLCAKAWQLIKNDFPQLPAFQMHLHKIIPMGAGLGGGSSDGAFTLKLINDLFELGLSTTTLLTYALQLGSDCPFFIINQPCVAAGRGEILEPVNLSLAGYYLILINPGIHISTREAFNFINAAKPSIPVNDIMSLPVSAWKNNLVNDFEPGVFQLHPPIAAIKNALYNEGALYASLTGTGSTVFGIFEKEPLSLPLINAAYHVETIKL